jgi:hypothetical protein
MLTTTGPGVFLELLHTTREHILLSFGECLWRESSIPLGVYVNEAKNTSPAPF